jgi:hypothetical protein
VQEPRGSGSSSAAVEGNQTRNEAERAEEVEAVYHPADTIWICQYGKHWTAGTGFIPSTGSVREMCLFCLELFLGWRKPFGSDPATHTDQSHSTKRTSPEGMEPPIGDRWVQENLDFPPEGTSVPQGWWDSVLADKG